MVCLILFYLSFDEKSIVTFYMLFHSSCNNCIFALSQRGKFIEKIAFAKRPAREKTKFQIHREVKVKRSCFRRGRCFAL